MASLYKNGVFTRDYAAPADKSGATKEADAKVKADAAAESDKADPKKDGKAKA